MVLWLVDQDFSKAKNYICHMCCAAINSVLGIEATTTETMKYFFFRFCGFSYQLDRTQKKLSQNKNIQQNCHMRSLKKCFCTRVMHFSILSREEIYLGFYDMILTIENSPIKS